MSKYKIKKLRKSDIVELNKYLDDTEKECQRQLDTVAQDLITDCRKVIKLLLDTSDPKIYSAMVVTIREYEKALEKKSYINVLHVSGALTHIASDYVDELSEDISIEEGGDDY